MWLRKGLLVGLVSVSGGVKQGEATAPCGSSASRPWKAGALYPPQLFEDDSAFTFLGFQILSKCLL